MKRFTQTLPKVLERLEIVRQVLEVHGIVPADDAWKPIEKDEIGNDWVINWCWRRGNVELFVSVSLGGDNDTECSGVELRLTRIDDGYVNIIGYLTDFKWLIDFERHSDVGLNDMWWGLPEGDIAKDHFSDTAAREFMSMVIGFFAKLPVDQAKAA